MVVEMGLTDVKHVILVLSGKGGVGKSSVAVHLALCFQNLGFKTGLLDIDLCGPSIPHMLNLEDKDVHKCSEGWMPVFADDTQNLSVMSIGFLLKNRDAAVVWRGPKKNAMIKQFLSDVHWQGIDYLVVDMPPGTTDEHITLVENIGQISHIGAVLVTTPQVISVNDVRREVTFCQKAGITALGVIENMSGFVCPTCQECTAVFSKGGGEALATEMNIPFLGSIPLDPSIMEYIDKRSLFLDNWKSATLQTIREITEAILKSVA